MKAKNASRRNFLKKSALTTGAATVGSLGVANRSFAADLSSNKLPREVWIAGISQEGLRTPTSRSMVDEVIGLVEAVAVYQPDIICTPELFPISNVEEQLTPLARKALSEDVLQKFSALAKQFNCYIICSLSTFEGAKKYNSAVVLDRGGVRLGEYRKTHLPEDELKAGFTPGPLSPPVFQTDFGKIGIQICFDILWDESWAMLRKQGAEIVFWPSAFAGGKMVNTKAWQHKFVMVSSTRKNTSKICDITGEVVAQTGFWERNFFCAPVNLEKAFLHTWPYVKHFGAIRKKFGRKVRITNFHEEEWSIIESLSPDVLVADIMEEFGLRTYEEHAQDAEANQIKARKD